MHAMMLRCAVLLQVDQAALKEETTKSTAEVAAKVAELRVSGEQGCS
jgi:hypothetical protein